MYGIRYSREGGCYTVGDTSGGGWEPLSDHNNMDDAQDALEHLQNPIIWRHIADLSNQVRELQNQVAALNEAIERAGLLTNE